jgi:hypothetical protein
MTRAAAAAAAAAVLAIYWLRLDTAAGLIGDDAWYLVLAKALAQGDGYRLISSAATEILPAVPPGFPAILSLVFRVSPSFPDNLLWLKLVSVLAMLGAGLACWVDFTRHRGVPPLQALLLVTATVITPAFVFLATSTVMADCVFTFAQVLAVVLVERARRAGDTATRPAIVAGVVAAAAVLFRTAGVAVVAAAIAYFVFARRWRQAAAFAIVVAVCLAPWQLYARAHAPTFEQRLAHGGTIAFSYQQLMAMTRPGDTRSAGVSLGDTVQRIGRNVSGILTRDVGAVLVPAFYRGPAESGQEVVSVVGGTGQVGSMGRAGATMVVSLILSAIVAAGIASRREWLSLPALLIAASAAIIALVGSQTFRYVVPLAPFLLLFFWRGLRSGSLARIAVLVLLGFNLMDHALYIQQKLTATPDWLADARETDELLAWMSSNLTGPGAVATDNPGLVFLKTGRKTVASANPDVNWSRWKAGGVRYVVAVRRSDLPAESRGARVLFQTARRRLWLVEI